MIKHDDAIATLQTLAHSEEQSKAARDQQTGRFRRFTQLRATWAQRSWSPTPRLVQRYNHLVVARARQPAALHLARFWDAPKTDEAHRADDLFPPWVNLNYRPGAHFFSIVPSKRPLPGPYGNIDMYVEYDIQDGTTPYSPLKIRTTIRVVAQ